MSEHLTDMAAYVWAWQVEVSRSKEEQMGLRVDAAQEVMMRPASVSSI